MRVTAKGLVVVVCAGVLATGCGDDAGPSGGTDAGVTRIDGGGVDGSVGVDSGGGVDSGESAGGGDCATDADCPGGTCIELVPGGYRVCNVPPHEATECTKASLDECCDSTECATGACYLGPVAPFCGGPGVIPHNECAMDECNGETDCPTSTICVRGGSLGRIVAGCVFAACRTDADCAEEAGGACVTVADPCCGVQSLACVYPDGCRSSTDCPGGACVLDGSRMVCTTMPPACPA